MQRPDDHNRLADLWAVTAYFNSAGYLTKKRNFQRFRERLRQDGVPLLTVECSFGDRPFELDADADILRIVGRDVMWQKERLLNVAVGALPSSCRKVAWLDCDILFEQADWAREASRMLEDVPVIQLFDRAIRLPRGQDEFIGVGDIWNGFASIYRRQPQQLMHGDFAAHGHTGFAWAARREVIEAHGLYDACIAGSGDHMMAHAFCGDWTSRCIERIIGANNRHHTYFADWCRRVYRDVRSRVGFLPGTVLHLWHGEIDRRRYVDRNRELAAFDFDPRSDLRIGASGCWEWSSRKSKLHHWADNYFKHRLEDGENRGVEMADAQTFHGE